jgi:hypothetical protein
MQFNATVAKALKLIDFFKDDFSIVTLPTLRRFKASFFPHSLKTAATRTKSAYADYRIRGMYNPDLVSKQIGYPSSGLPA